MCELLKMGVNMPRKSDKRERLVQSAENLMFKQGFNLTTLADIAQEADVPLGNVYYYFKTKESIGDAVIAHCLAELTQRLTDLNALATPSDRLHAFVNYIVDDRDWVVRYGDKLGGLCQELAKQGGTLAAASSNILQQSLNWLEKQFKELGSEPDSAKDKAKVLMAKVQGMCLLAATFGDAQHLESMRNWVAVEFGVPAGVSTVTSREPEEAFA